MGLDITAYRQLSKIATPELDEDGEPKDWDKVFSPHAGTLRWTEENWPGRTEGLVIGYYSFADAYGFRADSYGGYGQWRNQLATFAGHGSAQAVWNGIASGPFVELVNFADNEGYIGPVVAAKLAKDFAEHQDRVDAFAEGLGDIDGPWFRGRYADWRKALEMAADGGAVNFH